MRPTPNQMIAEAKVVHNGMIMKLFASWRALLLTYCEIITKYQITFLFYFWVCSILEPSPWSLWSETLFSHRSVFLKFVSVLVFFQGLPTTRVRLRYDLHCPLHTTTTLCPTSLPTAWTETPWEADETPFTHPLRGREMVRPPLSLSSYKTAGCLTVTCRWRPGQSIYFLFCFGLFFCWRVYLTLISGATYSKHSSWISLE